MREQQEKEAIRQLKAVISTAWSFSTNSIKKAVYRTAYGIARYHDLAEEATQKVFIGLPIAIQSYDGDRPFFPWLYRIAVRRAVDEARRGKKRPPKTPLTTYPAFHRQAPPQRTKPCGRRVWPPSGVP